MGEGRARLLRWSLAAFIAACPVQAEDASQKVYEELKNVHVTLGRLVQLMEGVSQTQRAILLQQQIQLNESRLAALQGRDDKLAAQERDQNKAAGAFSTTAQSLNSGIGPNGLPVPDPDMHAAAREDVSNRLSSANRLLEQTRSQRTAILKQMDELRSRIAALEKSVAGGVR